MKTTNAIVKDLYNNRTPIVAACEKVQISVKEVIEGKPTFVTEVVFNPCKRIENGFCSSCAYPDKKWRLGICNLASHLYIENKVGQKPKVITPLNMKVEDFKENKTVLNPIKQSKRGSR